MYSAWRTSRLSAEIGETEPWPGSRDLVSHLVIYTVGERGVERRAGLVIAPEDAAPGAELSGLPACHEPAEGWGHDPASGFVHERLPTVSPSSLAYDENPPPTLLMNQPRRTRGIVRVTSLFTVESESPWSHVPFDDGASGSSPEPVAATPVEHAEFARTVIESLKRSHIHAAPPAAEAEIFTSARSSRGLEVATSSATWSPTGWGRAASSAEQAS